MPLLLYSLNWRSITYGKNRFVTVGMNTNKGAYWIVKKETPLDTEHFVTPTAMQTAIDNMDLSAYATNTEVAATYATSNNPAITGGTISSTTLTGVWIDGTSRLSDNKMLTTNGSDLIYPAAGGTIATLTDITTHTPDLTPYATLTGTETLTNKTLSSPIINSVIVSNGKNIALPSTTGTLATLGGTETLTNKTLTTPTISTIMNGNATLTLPSTTGTLALTSDVPQYLQPETYDLTDVCESYQTNQFYRDFIHLAKITSNLYILTISGYVANTTTGSWSIINSSHLSSSQTFEFYTVGCNSTGSQLRRISFKLYWNGLEYSCNAGTENRTFTVTTLLVLNEGKTITVNLS